MSLWAFPEIQQHASNIPSSECWECEDPDDDIFEMPMNEPIHNIETKTSEDQLKTEKECGKKIKLWLLKNDIIASTQLHRRKTIDYLSRGLGSLGSGYTSLDCSRTWICYWIINSFNLLSADMHLTNNLQENLIKFLKTCQHPKGGFGGGPLQYAHMAATFGAIMALISLGNEKAYNVINRDTFKQFIMRQKQLDGSFSVQDGGEIDIRAAYCGLACASVLNIIDEKMCKNTLLWLKQCQTYQGGFAQEPDDEAHGGYAYCGVAAYIIIQSHFPHLVTDENIIDIEKLIRWQAFKQMQYSGGFQGRTNKLVDACYSFWVGAVFPMIQRLKQLRKEWKEKIKYKQNDEESKEDDVNNDGNDNDGNDNDDKDGDDEKKEYDCGEFVPLFNSLQLQKYILVICQSHQGGITDKPPKPSDYYHTCYGLSGLSIAQGYDNKLLGPQINRLETIDPVYGILENKLVEAWNYFRKIDGDKNKNNDNDNENDKQ